MIKESLPQDTTFVNIYAPNIDAPRYTKQILTDPTGEIDNSTKIVGDLNIQLTIVDRSSRKKISKDTLALNYVLDHIDLDVYRTFYQKEAHGTFSRIDHMLGHKTSPNTFKSLKSYQASFLTSVI